MKNAVSFTVGAILLSPVLTVYIFLLELSFDAQKIRLHDLFSEMPKENLSTLHFLVDHLNIIQQYQDVNKMNASNLAIVFWPTLMRPALRDLADPSKHIAWQLALAKVIENPDLVPAIDYV